MLIEYCANSYMVWCIMAACFIFMSTLLPNCQHCSFSVGNRVDRTVIGLTNTGSYIFFVLITAPSSICHTILRSVLWCFSLSRVYFVWISYILYKILVREWAYPNLNMLLEHRHFLVTLQCLVLKSKQGWLWVQRITELTELTVLGGTDKFFPILCLSYHFCWIALIALIYIGINLQ